MTERSLANLHYVVLWQLQQVTQQGGQQRYFRRLMPGSLSPYGIKSKIRKLGIELVHSTPVYPQGYRYVKNAATLNYDILYSSITISGHTHKPSAYLYTKEKRNISASVYIPTDQFDNRLMLVERESMERQETFDVSLKSGQRYYINPGSVGQPRDGTPKASYMIYDTVAKQASLKKAAYNTEVVKKKVLKATLPFDLAERIVKGV